MNTHHRDATAASAKALRTRRAESPERLHAPSVVPAAKAAVIPLGITSWGRPSIRDLKEH